MPDLGIVELITALGGADLLGGGAAAAGAGAGLAGGGTALAAGGADLAGLAGLGAGAAGATDALTSGATAAPVDAGGGIGAGLSGGGTALEAGGADLAGLALPANAGLTAGTTPSDIVANGFSDLNPPSGATPVTTTPVTPSGPMTAGGVTSVGPSSGIPNSVLSNAGLAPTGAAPAAPIAAGTGTGSGFDLSSLVGNASPLQLAGAGVGAAGLGYSILNANKSSPSTQAIQNEVTAVNNQIPALQQTAQGLQTQGQQLTDQGTKIANQGQGYTDYLASGTLPPALQTQVDQTIAANKQHIISNYAAQGMNTDPTKNSSLRQELDAVDQQGKVLAGQLAQQLLTSGTGLIGAGTGLETTGANQSAVGASDLINIGTSYAGINTALLTQLSNIDQTQTANVGRAIASFASALAGNRPTVNINTNQNTPGTITATA